MYKFIQARASRYHLISVLRVLLSLSLSLSPSVSLTFILFEAQHYVIVVQDKLGYNYIYTRKIERTGKDNLSLLILES